MKVVKDFVGVVAGDLTRSQQWNCPWAFAGQGCYHDYTRQEILVWHLLVNFITSMTILIVDTTTGTCNAIFVASPVNIKTKQMRLSIAYIRTLNTRVYYDEYIYTSSYTRSIHKFLKNE